MPTRARASFAISCIGGALNLKIETRKATGRQSDKEDLPKGETRNPLT